MHVHGSVGGTVERQETFMARLILVYLAQRSAAPSSRGNALGPTMHENFALGTRMALIPLIQKQHRFISLHGECHRRHRLPGQQKLHHWDYQ
jgi:hypothetical protein